MPTQTTVKMPLILLLKRVMHINNIIIFDTKKNPYARKIRIEVRMTRTTNTANQMYEMTRNDNKKMELEHDTILIIYLLEFLKHVCDEVVINL